MPDTYEFDPHIVRAICDYMNARQPDSNAYIARWIGGLEECLAAEMITFSQESITYRVQTPRGDENLVIAWLEPVRSREEAREGLFALVDHAYELETESSK